MNCILPAFIGLGCYWAPQSSSHPRRTTQKPKHTAKATSCNFQFEINNSRSSNLLSFWERTEWIRGKDGLTWLGSGDRIRGHRNHHGVAPLYMGIVEIPPPANRGRKKKKKRKQDYVEPDRLGEGTTETGYINRPLTDRYIVVPESEFSFRDRDPLDQLGLKDKTYAKVLYLQNVNHNLVWQTQLFAEKKQSLLFMVHGFHTSGKSDVVKKLCIGFEHRGMMAYSFKKPTWTEQQYNFLWRYHRKLPAKGQVGFWIRSWYEDVTTSVLNEDISEEEAEDRIEMILDFERILMSQGVKIVKIYLQISDLVAFQRLEEHTVIPKYMWQVTKDDFDQKARFNEIQKRWESVIRQTSTEQSPWYIVPSSLKWIRNTVMSQILRDTFADMGPEIPEELLRGVSIQEALGDGSNDQDSAEGSRLVVRKTEQRTTSELIRL